MATGTEIARDISAVSNMDDLRIIQLALKRRWLQVQREAAGSFDTLDRVEFTPRDGVLRHGTVVKINQKSISVRTDDGGNWKVGSTLLTKVV